MPRRLTVSPSPWRISTELISCRRGRSRIALSVSRSISSCPALVSARWESRRFFGSGNAGTGGRSASATPDRMPLASIAKREPYSPAACTPAIVTSSPAAVKRCANSPIASATCLPVCVPLVRALSRMRPSSGPTLPLAPSATRPTVASRSSSIFLRFASACLNSWSEKSCPDAASWRSAECPASADFVIAWSRPLNASASARRKS